MTHRYRLPALRPSGTTGRPNLNEIVEPLSNGAWVDKVLVEEATRVRGIAMSIADAAVYTVTRVFERHGLVDKALDIRDNDAVYRLITEIATRIFHERLIERLGDDRRDRTVRKEVSVSMRLRECQEYGR